MKTAHYFKTAGVAFVVISTTYAPRGVQHVVSGKREAREVAARAGAVCWNF